MSAPVDNPVLLEVYTGKDEQKRTQYRWRAVIPGNHTKIATGGESYNNIADLLHALTRLWPGEGTSHLSVRLPRRRNGIPFNRALTLTEEELR